ncbi:MAG: thioredoxin-disulfide reductase, partial [Chlorobi bacterium]|nr:thioredoxin-disulfide reductase [Chlorobiota bacterium]
AIGRVPNFDFFKISQDNIKSLLTSGKLFFAGDIKNGIYRQTSLSVGDGVRAAMSVRKDVGH